MSWGQNKADSKNFSMAYSCTTYFISSCKEFDKAVADAYNIKKSKILPIGMPRNDIFFKKINDSVIKTREKLNIAPEFGIVLYAPTYMGSAKKAFSNTTLNIENLRRVLKYSYHKNFIILIRSHYYVNSEMLNIRDAIDVTDYDVQELLLISDILITDYSSISWDFSLQKKPCFIFAPNLNYYTTTDRNFYTPIEKWPWPIAQTNEELNDNIMNFNQNKYLQKLEEHWNYMGSYERGKATKEIIKIIERSF
jgi:CDP-glycerol glycerophosphotransferase